MTVDGGEPSEWAPRYAQVRTATEAEVAAIDDRVAEADERSYTTVYEFDGLEMVVAHTPEHTRVRVSAYGEDIIEAHYELDPSASPSPVLLGGIPGHPIVACSTADETCVDLDDDAAE